MGVKLDFEAVNALPNPLQPGTIYFVDNLDGTATMVVTDATGQIAGRQVVGLMTSGALARTGAVQSGAVKTGTAFFQKFTPTRDITLTSVTIQGLSVLSGTARIRVSPNDGAGTTALADAAASSGSGGVTAPVNYTLTAGTPYIIGAYGASLSLTLSSGHAWDGLTQPDTALITSTPSSGGWTQLPADGTQMAFLFDVAAIPFRRVEFGNGMTGEVAAGVLTLDAADPLPAGQLSGMVLRATGPDPTQREWAYIAGGGRSITGTTGSLAVNAPGSLDLGNTHVPTHVSKVTTTAAADICLYYSAADRTTDSGRLVSTPNAAPSVPVIGQWRTSASVPSVAGEARGINSGTVYAALVNRSESAAALTLTLTLEDA
ncbi:hypothetical protein [Deinococcus enclensis]|uniref:Uncharacterized protein n=1 Tax=Deinococcus enclensis TaxID=1049582 RepID=A0ABT9MB68_9DEIO|nr:hypothetical protein [Deinococcus enclensis]MDP9763834.1 hypothetical protein [Deinococcus enclensis]